MGFGDPGTYNLVVGADPLEPLDFAVVKKMLGRLNDSVLRGGPLTQSLRFTGPDGTEYVAQIGPGIRKVTVTRTPLNPEQPTLCHCLSGVLSAPTPISYPASTAFGSTIPFVFEDKMYFLEGNALLSFDPVRNVFVNEPGIYTIPFVLDESTQTQVQPYWNISNPAFAYRHKDGNIRIIVQAQNLTNRFFEYEIGVGYIETYLADNSAIASLYPSTTPSDRAAPAITAYGAIDNSKPGKWQQSSVIPVFSTPNNVLTYDYLNRKWSASVGLIPANDSAGAMGLFNGSLFTVCLLDGTNTARPAFTGFPIKGGAQVNKTLPFAQVPYGRMFTQLCCCMVLAGGIVNDNLPAPNYWDTNAIWHVNLQTGQVKRIGNAPWPGDPVNSDYMSMLVPISTKTYLFSSTTTVGTPNTYGQCQVSVIS